MKDSGGREGDNLLMVKCYLCEQISREMVKVVREIIGAVHDLVL